MSTACYMLAYPSKTGFCSASISTVHTYEVNYNSWGSMHGLVFHIYTGAVCQGV